MTSLTNLVLTPDPPVNTIFDCFWHFDESGVGVLGSDVFAPIGSESKGGIFVSDVFVPTGVYSKGDQLLAFFWLSNY